YTENYLNKNKIHKFISFNKLSSNYRSLKKNESKEYYYLIEDPKFIYCSDKKYKMVFSFKASIQTSTGLIKIRKEYELKKTRGKMVKDVFEAYIDRGCIIL
ncbi:MAG: hypothetical protein KKH98_11445, partial [Spirochaetes bacterium]|nr:hypothetical protein [Spirochaetota bacterium]